MEASKKRKLVPLQEHTAFHQQQSGKGQVARKSLKIRTKKVQGLKVDVAGSNTSDPSRVLPATETSSYFSDLKTSLSQDLFDEIMDFNRSYPTMQDEYLIVDKIGEGTFSSVYKARVVNMDQHRRYLKALGSAASAYMDDQYVAIKRIYSTSSPTRIYNELKLLYALKHPNVVPLITARRRDEQIVAILPYFEHDEFKDILLGGKLEEMKHYMRCLFAALEHVHQNKILHRDIKPSNFLYNRRKKTGVLVDFGLAHPAAESKVTKLHGSTNTFQARPGYYPNDARPSVRANRAGTRGFRAPEILFKLVHQTTAIDVWSAGVVLLTFLTCVYPFFNSNDDEEAIIEIAMLFGMAEMQELAHKLNRTFNTTIPSIPPSRPDWLALIESLNPGVSETLPSDALDLLEACLTLDPEARITASKALEHPFLKI